eukprot:12476360-Alexandrium_andersonii.AAC.1
MSAGARIPPSVLFTARVVVFGSAPWPNGFTASVDTCFLPRDLRCALAGRSAVGCGSDEGGLAPLFVDTLKAPSALRRKLRG